MTLLDEIRSYHENEDNFETITIPGNLLDVATAAIIERKYKRFLETQISYFPYMLMSQWRTFFGKSRVTGHRAIHEMIDLKILGQETFKGCDYLFPLTAAMKWFSKKERVNPYKPKLSNNLLLDYFMRAEYFLVTNQLLQVTPDYFFNRMIWDRRASRVELAKLNKELTEKKANLDELQQTINGLSQNAAANLSRIISLAQQEGELSSKINELQNRQAELNEKIKEKEKGLPSLNLPEIAEGGALDCLEEFKDRKVFKNRIPSFKNKLDYFPFVQQCLQILPDRNCYFENIHMTEEGFKLELAMIHYHDNAKARYHRLIDDVNLICNCFIKGSFTLRLLCESEKDQERADKVLKEVFRQRRKSISSIQQKRTNRQNLCEKYVVTNTNIARYFQKANTDLLIHEANLKDLEQIIANLTSE